MHRFNRGLLLIVLGVSSLPALAGTGLFSQVTVLTAPTPTAGNYFGYGRSGGVALSADGKTALIGAPFASVGTAKGAGKAFIFAYANGSWALSQEIDDPDASADDNFGAAVALSADGGSVLIGSAATVNGKKFAGKAYLFTLNNALWTQAREFDDPAPAAADNFGFSGVALSGDGKTAIIGAAQTAVNGQSAAGKVYIFNASSGTWNQTATIADPDNAPGDLFGSTVAISGDGKRVLIGSQAAVNGHITAGKAYLYTSSSGFWTQAREFDDPAATDGDNFGSSALALSADGKTAVIGAKYTVVNDNTDAGKVYIFSETNGVWNQAAALADPDTGNLDLFGSAVAVSADGMRVLIGSGAAVNGQNGAGKAYLYALANGNWIRAREFDDPGATTYDEFGRFGAALSADGEAALISASLAAVNGLAKAGIVYVYQSPVDVSVAIAAKPATVASGQQATLELTVTNNDREVTANNLNLRATLASGINFASSNAAGGNCSTSDATISCTLTRLAAGQIWQPTVTVNAESVGNYDLTASVLHGKPDSNMANNQTTAQLKVNAASADLSIAFAFKPATATVGQQVKLELTVTNNDNAVTAENVALTRSAPAGEGVFNIVNFPASCDVVSGQMRCTITSLAPGETAERSATVTTLAAGSYSYDANVVSDTPDSNTDNNHMSATLVVNAAVPPPTQGSSSGGGGGFDLPGLALLAGLLTLIQRRRSGT